MGILLWLLILQADSLKAYKLEEIVVTATKIEEPKREIGKSVTIITKEEIEKEGSSTVFEVIRNLLGVDVVQTGAFGGKTSVYLRGHKPSHTLVLVDGVKVNNPISPDRSFNWATFPTTCVERIEVIRGPQSALYGSDAIGGVINIITKGCSKCKGRIKFKGSLSFGSYNTFEQKVGISGKERIFDYSLSLFNTNSEGISKALSKEDTVIPEKDGYKNTGVYAKFNLYPINNLSIGATSGLTDAKIDIDDGAFKDDPNFEIFSKHIYGNLFVKYKITDRWNSKVILGVNDIGRKYEDKMSKDSTESKSNYEGKYTRIEWQNNFSLHKHLKIITGLESEKEIGKSFRYKKYKYHGEQKIDTFEIPEKSVFNRSFYIEFEPSYRNLFLTLGSRIDEHERFGDHTTYQTSFSWLINSTRLKANYGVGFKAPTIYQLYHPKYGDTLLKPETSIGYDVGGEYKFRDGVIEINYFNTYVKDEIVWENRKYVNKKEWWTEGIEFNLRLFIIKDLRMDIGYTGMEIEPTSSYVRRCAHKYRWVINYKWINLKFNCTGKRYDRDWSSWPPKIVSLHSYRKIDLTISHKLKWVKVQWKIENLLNEEYMEVYGYSTPGRSYYIGISY